MLNSSYFNSLYFSSDYFLTSSVVKVTFNSTTQLTTELLLDFAVKKFFNTTIVNNVTITLGSSRFSEDALHFYDYTYYLEQVTSKDISLYNFVNDTYLLSNYYNYLYTLYSNYDITLNNKIDYNIVLKDD